MQVAHIGTYALGALGRRLSVLRTCGLAKRTEVSGSRLFGGCPWNRFECLAAVVLVSYSRSWAWWVGLMPGGLCLLGDNRCHDILVDNGDDNALYYDGDRVLFDDLNDVPVARGRCGAGW